MVYLPCCKCACASNTNDFKGFRMQEKIEKISLTKCKSILQKNGRVFSDTQILEIRDFLYKLAEMDYKVFLKTKIREAAFNNQKTDDEENQLKNAA